LAFATFLVWQLRTGACGVGAYGFWRYRMPPDLYIGEKKIERKFTASRLADQEIRQT